MIKWFHTQTKPTSKLGEMTWLAFPPAKSFGRGEELEENENHPFLPSCLVQLEHKIIHTISQVITSGYLLGRLCLILPHADHENFIYNSRRALLPKI